RTNGDPTTRSVETHSDVWKITKGQSHHGEAKPQPPSALPKVIVNERSKDADGKANSEPNGLPSDEKIDVSMTVARKSTCAKEHDNPDNKKSQHGEKKDIGTLTMHSQVERIFCFESRTSLFFSLGFAAFPLVVFDFVVLGINSSRPIRSLRGSSI